MAQWYCIFGITRPNHLGATHEDISHLHYYEADKNEYWWMTAAYAIDLIDSGKGVCYTHEGGVFTKIRVVNRGGNRYLRTSPDHVVRDNLLSLPNRPI